MDEASVWGLLLARARQHPHAAMPDPARVADPAARGLLELYLPLLARSRFVVAHLGQSLDGRIALVNGASRWVTGPLDVIHNHRMRALFDAVVVGATTIEQDDPNLTVRAVPGDHPTRVVIDLRRRLGVRYRVFEDGAARTLLICSQELLARGERHGQAEVIGIGMADGGVPRAVLERLLALGLKRVFVEGGGVTVSRFLAARCLDRLQITVAPVILGSGRPAISLPEIAEVGDGLRPAIRRFDLGDDTLYEARLGA